VVYTYNGMLKEILIHATTWMNPENITLTGNKPVSRGLGFNP
jgi:hypothetical protein